MSGPIALPLLRVENLQKSFSGFIAVNGVSFDVGAGEIIALIGPNGAGKTTTFNMITGQTAVDSGRVLFDGHDVTGTKPRDRARTGIARTFQITATFASMTVAENVAVAFMARDGLMADLAPAAERYRDAAMALLYEAGIKDQAGRLCSTLAYGDLKRVELAMALGAVPRLLLMDEPTAGMAPAERSHLMRLVSRLATERNMAVLFTEHDMDIVFAHAHRILVMNRGELIAAGTPDAVHGNAVVREVYLGRSTAIALSSTGRP